ncbi:MAG: rhodanese-like domain-containing protein [Bacteroidia bacterium]|nr:rhodanese-like domain-containing protein [Bacteroidia bacterium]
MKISIFLFVSLTAVCLEAIGQEADSLKYTNLEPYDFHLNYLKDDTAMLIDVREYFEYKKSRIKGAVNIPSSGNIDMAADTIGKNMSLFIYCTSGYRAKKAAARMADKGFRKVFNLDGGIKAWKEDGFPVEKKRLKGAKAQGRKGKTSEK